MLKNIRKSNVIQKVVNSLIIDSPLPSNLNYFYNFGSLQGLNLVIMLITGITLAMHYTAHVDQAFFSVEHIMREVNSGWQLRFIHANGASVFFILVFIHMARGLYYGSYRYPREGLWITGVMIFALMIGIAFLGYTLVFGQMSFWGITVITNLFSAIPWIGDEIVRFIQGGPSVTNATLNRFFSLHYCLPFVQTGIIILHLYFLNLKGSNNPLGMNSNCDKIRFHPYFTIKDQIGFCLQGLFYILQVFYYPYVLNHPDNSIPANPMVTPLHITPEWYLLPFYAILRSIPSKQGGVIAMAAAIQILFFLPVFQSQNVRSNKFKPVLQILFWIFVFNFLQQIKIGGCPIEEPYVLIGQIASVYYFVYFIILFLLG